MALLLVRLTVPGASMGALRCLPQRLASSPLLLVYAFCLLLNGRQQQYDMGLIFVPIPRCPSMTFEKLTSVEHAGLFLWAPSNTSDAHAHKSTNKAEKKVHRVIKSYAAISFSFGCFAKPVLSLVLAVLISACRIATFHF